MTNAMYVAIFSAFIALMSLAVSVSTMYFTWLRRGRLAMTKPTLVFFGFDKVHKRTAKIFLRTLLYSTSVKGKVVEGMYVKLYRDDVAETFSFWGYGETEKISPGSGLFVSESGVAANHHFVMSAHQPAFDFAAGNYRIEVFARLAGESKPLKLADIAFTVEAPQAASLSVGTGVLFELLPDAQKYVGHVDSRNRPH